MVGRLLWSWIFFFAHLSLAFYFWCGTVLDFFLLQPGSCVYKKSLVYMYVRVDIVMEMDTNLVL